MAERVRRLLREGPATAPEVAAEFEWSTHAASNILQSLLLLGHVRVSAKLKRSDPGRGRRQTNIYTLTNKGLLSRGRNNAG